MADNLVAIPQDAIEQSAAPTQDQSQTVPIPQDAQSAALTQDHPGMMDKAMKFLFTGDDTTKAADQAQADMGTGFVKGAEDTAAGIAHMADKAGQYLGVDKLAARAMGGGDAAAQDVVGLRNDPNEGQNIGQNAMREQAKPKNLAEAVGYGGETLTEFLLGDEALKGLSLSDRLLQSHQIAKVLEQSPRLMKAIQMGANVGKAATQLGPEEQALLKQYPTIAKLVGVGMDALRGGAIQAAQTTTRSGGDVEKGAKEGGVMTGISAAIGAPLAGASSLISKFAKGTQDAAESVANAAESTPDKGGVVSKVKKGVEDFENTMHDEFQKGIDKLHGHLEDQTIPHEGSPLQKAAQSATETIPGPSNLSKGVQEATKNLVPGTERVQPLLKELSGASEEAGTHYKYDPSGNSNLQHQVTTVGDDGQKVGELAAQDVGNGKVIVRSNQIYDAANRGKGYGKDQVKTLIGNLMADKTVKTVSSDISTTGDAQNVWKSLKKEFPDAITEKMNGARPTWSVDLDKMRDTYSKALDTVAGVDKEAAQPWTSQGLVELRQKLTAQARQMEYGDPNRRVISKLVDGIDQTMDQLAGQSKNPEAADAYQKLRDTYKQKIELLKSTPIDKLSTDASGKVVDDVGKYLLTGNNSKSKIQALRQVLGDKQMSAVTDSIFKNWVSDATEEGGKVNYDKVIKQWDKAKDVRDELFNRSVASPQKYSFQDLIDNADTAASANKLIKSGLVTGGVLTAPLSGLIALSSHLYGGKNISQMLDYIASHPNTWKALGAVGKAGEAAQAAVPATAKGATSELTKKPSGKSLQEIYAGTEGALSQ